MSTCAPSCSLAVNTGMRPNELFTLRKHQLDFTLNLITLGRKVRGQQDRTVNLPFETCQTVDGEHGRIETRRYWSIVAVDWLPGKTEWRDLCSVGMVEAQREVAGKVSVKVRYYLSSLPVDVQRLAEAVRGHWSVENSCHWVLDVVFREDDSRVRTGFGAENVALLRRLANGLLQQERTAKVGVYNKRLKAALDEQYLLKVLNPQKSQHL